MDEYLDSATKSIAVATAAGFVCSILFDSGYLWWLGLTIGSTPMTIADHVRTAMMWLPLFLLVAPLVLVQEYVFRIWDRRLDRAEQNSPVLARTLKAVLHDPFFLRGLSPIGRVGVLMVLPGIVGALWGGALEPFTLLLTASLVLIVLDPIWGKDSSSSHDITWLRQYMIKLLLFLCVLIWVSVPFLGVLSAHRNMQASEFQRGVVLRTTSASTRNADYLPLRQFEKFYLMLDTNWRVVVVRTDDVVELRARKENTPLVGVLCSKFSIACATPK